MGDGNCETARNTLSSSSFLERILVAALSRCEISASGRIPRVASGSQTLTGGRNATVLLVRVRTGCAARLANLAKRLECGQLAGAFGPPTARQSGSKLHALQALRDIRLRLPRCEICRLGRLEPAYHYPQFRNAVAANLQ